MTWGTTAIMLMLAIGEANKEQMVRQMQEFGQNVVSLWPGWTSKPFKGLNKYRGVQFSLDDLKDVKKLPGIETAGGEVGGGPAEVSWQNKEAEFVLRGIDPEWAKLRNITSENGGRIFNKTDILQKRRVALIGAEVKSIIFGKINPVGEHFYINQAPFVVIGVLPPKFEASFHRDRKEETVFIPLTTCMSMKNRFYINNIAYRAKDLKKNKQTLSAVRHYLARKKFFDPEDNTAVFVWDMTDSDEFIGEFTFGLQFFMAVVGAFTMTVAAVGVANIMNVIVEERTKEIGIKMALGIKRRAIIFQFIVESFIFTFAGGILGLGISKLICAVLSTMELKGMGKPDVTLFVAVITTCVLGVAAFLSGFFPAKRAANLDPVLSLRWQ